MLPNLLVIGAMKAGTSSLYAYLRSHPQVFMSERKELHFFSGGTWDRGLAWYEHQFDAAGDAVVVGEASPHYAMADAFPEAAPRIAAHLPDSRLIYLVRHPIDRIRSHYIHEWANGRETRPLAEAALARDAFIGVSRYYRQLEPYLERFPRERLHVVISERLRDDRAETIRGVLAFLGVDDHLDPTAIAEERHRSADKRLPSSASAALHRFGWYRAARRLVPQPVRRLTRRVTTTALDPAMLELPPHVELEIRARLAPDVARLRSVLGPGFDGWGLA